MNEDIIAINRNYLADLFSQSLTQAQRAVYNIISQHDANLFHQLIAELQVTTENQAKTIATLLAKIGDLTGGVPCDTKPEIVVGSWWKTDSGKYVQVVGRAVIRTRFARDQTEFNPSDTIRSNEMPFVEEFTPCDPPEWAPKDDATEGGE